MVRDLEKILENSNVSSLIIPSTYKAKGQYREYKEYLLTKDGFILYMFNIQGYNDFKMAYINKFNEMEKALKEQSSVITEEQKLVLSIYNGGIDAVEGAKKLVELKTKPLENKINMLTHVNKLYTSTEIAKELGFKSAIEFNRVLEENKIQYKVNGTWVLTAKYANLGYESIKQNVLDSGKVIYDRKFTQEGRDFLIKFFRGDING